MAGAFSHLTAASAEIEGRSYGGGVLELEPTEAERPGAVVRIQQVAEAGAVIAVERPARALSEQAATVPGAGMEC